MTKWPETNVEAPAVAAKRGGRLLPPARYRHPGDMIRLIIAGLVLAGAPGASAVTRAAGAGAVAVSWLPVLPGWLSRRVLVRREYV